MYKFQLTIIPDSTHQKENIYLFIINLVSNFKNGTVPLFKIALDNLNELNWFFENETAIRNNKIPYISDNVFSIAKIIENFYEEVDPDDLAQLEMMFEFRKSHGIRFAFRGQDIADAYIGLNGDIYEISYSESIKSWCYEIDIDSLFIQLRHLLTSP